MARRHRHRTDDCCRPHDHRRQWHARIYTGLFLHRVWEFVSRHASPGDYARTFRRHARRDRYSCARRAASREIPITDGDAIRSNDLKKAAGEAYRQVKLLTGPASLAALGLRAGAMTFDCTADFVRKM